MLKANEFLTRRLVLTLSVGFGLSLLLMGALTFIGLRGLSETDARLKHIVERNSVKTQLASQMRDIMRDRAISMLSIVVMNDPFEKDQEMIRFYELGSQYQQTRLKLEPMLEDDQEQGLLQEIDRLTRTNQPLMVQTIDLGMDGYTFLAFEVLQNEAIPMQRLLVKKLNTLISMQQESTQTAGMEAARAYAKTRGLMLALGLTAAMIAILIASLVIRRTARLSAETERERTKFRTLFETNTDGIVILNEHGFNDCNSAALEMFGYHNADEFIRLQPEDLGVAMQPGGITARDLAVKYIQEAVARGHSVFEWRGRRRNGSEFDAEIALHAMRLDDRTYIQAIVRDISPQKEAEQTLKSAHAAALAAADMKSQFVANVSHEIRTPLNGILGMSRLLLRQDLPEPQKEYAETIHFSAEALLGIINDLLDFSKIEAGRLNVEHIVFDVPKLLRDVTALYTPRAQSKGLTLELSLDNRLPEWVTGDPLRLRQILLNLLDNAIKFTQSGTIRLLARYRKDSPLGACLRFSVVDSGIGIPQEALGHIFQAFSQADGSTSRKYGGTGLGLAICQQLAELMGGEISVESQPDQGSTFHLDLPLPISLEPPGPELRAEPAPAKLPRARVLVAEDNPVNQKVTRYMLENLGLEVSLAGDGKLAYETILARPPDLVLMDCQMPEWDGFMTTRAIRDWEARSGHSRIPIIALTANAMSGYGDQCQAAGMDAYLPKPLQEGELVALLKRWLPSGPAPQIHQTHVTHEVRDARDRHVPEATGSPPTPLPFDLERIQTLCRNDRDQIHEMLQLFMDSTRELLTALGQAIADDNPAGAARQAHQIKGAAAYIGAESMRQLAGQLDTLGKEGRLDGAAAVLSALQTTFDETAASMKTLMEKGPEHYN